MKGWYLVVAAIPFAVLGLVLWFTAWWAWMLALLLVAAGVAVWVRQSDRA